MALPPICHCDRRSKISALGHIAIGTWTTIGCNGCLSHFPFNKSSDHFMGRNYASYLNRKHSSRLERKRLQLNVRSATRERALNFNSGKTKSGLTRRNLATQHFENYGRMFSVVATKCWVGWSDRLDGSRRLPIRCRKEAERIQ